MAAVFLTGASGFVGAHVHRALEHRGHRVAVLRRDGPSASDLLSPGSYRADLEGAEVVVHLAAVTGKARPSEYARVNVEGTRFLLAAARDARCRFVLASTIAVRFPETMWYPYARSKREAERLVAGSGLSYAILRPTMVAGPGSPVFRGLARIARLPLIPAFGGAPALVQPILADDLAELVADLVESAAFDGRTLEFGGPETMSLRNLLDLIHRRISGRPGRFLHLPLGPVLPVLAALEAISWRLPPLTVGQMATFRFDGVAEANPLWERRRDRLAGIEEMLTASLPS